MANETETPLWQQTKDCHCWSVFVRTPVPNCPDCQGTGERLRFPGLSVECPGNSDSMLTRLCMRDFPDQEEGWVCPCRGENQGRVANVTLETVVICCWELGYPHVLFSNDVFSPTNPEDVHCFLEQDGKPWEQGMPSGWCQVEFAGSLKAALLAAATAALEQAVEKERE